MNNDIKTTSTPDPLNPGHTTHGVQSKPSTSTFPCRHGCERSFGSEPARRMHEIRAHLKPWSTTGNFKKKKTIRFPSDSPEYRKQKYRETVERYHARGLNAHGEPFKGNKMSQIMRKSWARRRQSMGKAQPIHRKKAIKQLLNGVAPTPTPEQDNMGDSARAIIMAAQVLRAVSLGMKL